MGGLCLCGCVCVSVTVRALSLASDTKSRTCGTQFSVFKAMIEIDKLWIK